MAGTLGKKKYCGNGHSFQIGFSILIVINLLKKYDPFLQGF